MSSLFLQADARWAMVISANAKTPPGERAAIEDSHALLHEQLPCRVLHQSFDRNEAHVRTRCCFTNGARIMRVCLASFNKRPVELYGQGERVLDHVEVMTSMSASAAV